MKTIVSILFLLFIGINSGFAVNPKADFNVIPLPQRIKVNSSAPFILSAKSKIYYGRGEERNAIFLQHYISDLTGLKLKLTNKLPGNDVISLVSENKFSVDSEMYTLTVDKKKIQIKGNSSAGLFYGIQTLRKALPVGISRLIKVPSVVINDFPRFPYRGVHLDVARHFFTVDSIKRYIDIIALHNVNRFHWHLTDDQGWRIEMKSRPNLTLIGSRRAQTMGDGKPYSGFYTQEQIRDIIKYAQERYITIIPEIDIPAHTNAVLASYPQLGCTGGPYKVNEVWGGTADVLCAGNPETMKFLYDVFSEVVELFPSKYIHIGGDECPKQRWKECPKCQAKIKELGIVSDSAHTAEEKLQSYIMVSVEKFLAAKGRKVIGWDEILEGGLGPDATVQSWRGMNGAIEAIKQGHNTILSPSAYCYFDYDQDKTTTLEKVFNFNPIPECLDTMKLSQILGVQANVWTEYMPTFKRVEYMLLPRLAALSEVQWSVPGRKCFEGFLKRLLHFRQIYEAYGYNYDKIIPKLQSEH